MFKLNFKIALRNLWKNKTSSLINIIGLAVGLAACLMLLVYVSYEWNFDRQSKNAEDVYLALTNAKDDKGEVIKTFDGTTTAFGPLIKQGIPEVKYLSRMDYGRQSLIANGDHSFKKLAKFAEPDLLKMYDYHFIEGNPNTALAQPRSVILTETTARILFGSTNVLNKSVRYQDQTDLKITGVIQDQPDNSSNKFDYLMPWSFYETVDEGAKDLNWTNFSFVTMVRLNPGANPDLVNKKIDALIKENNKDVIQMSFLYPLTRMHLYGEFEKGKSMGGDIEQIWLFMGLAFGILLIACINFMNMATAKSEKRAKEVGVKKTIGASWGSLVMQFLTESLVLALISMLVAIAMIELLLPFFNNLLDIKINISYFSPYIWLGTLIIVLLTGLIAGSYPAFYLSSFTPLQVLKKKVKGGRLFSISLRQVLVVGQFCFTMILMISTMVIYRQIQYIKNKPVGFNINALAEMPQDGKLKERFELLKTRLLKSGAVTDMYQSSVSLSHRGSNFTNIAWPGMVNSINLIMFNRVATTYDFIKTNGIKLLQGRDFSEKFASDTSAVLVSASAVKIMNLQKPIGSTIKLTGDPVTVIGVFDDYVWDSPYKSNNPMVVYLNKQLTGTITMRLNSGGDLQQHIETISNITKELNPAYPVEINFVHAIYQKKFQKEKTLGTLSNLFGGLAILVSCLGLFGLVAYSAEQRTKEFGIRKVLGASVASLMRILSLSFLKMIFAAIFLAIPIAYYLMGKWLEKFEFHTAIPWWIVVAAATGTILIAFLTVSYQAYKTATANPVDSLKYE